ncbi:MAG: glycosyltransferase family 2 protein [Dehalococcoidia bacterium]
MNRSTEPPNIAVVIPACNEAASIAKVLSDIPMGLAAEIVVVNNNSVDDTARIAREKGAIVVDEPRRGYGSACMKGVEYLNSQARKPDIIVFLDADFSDYPEEMVALIEPIFEQNFDLVLGSRAGGKMLKGAMPVQQIFGNRLATFLIKTLYGVQFTDLGPFRAVKFDKLLSLDLRDKTYGWPIEMQLKAVKQHLRVCEVPVSYRPRIGKSKISGTIKGTIMAGYKILIAILRYR